MGYNPARIVCILVPFLLTAASLVFLVVAGLAGTSSSDNLFTVRVNTTNISVPASSVLSLVHFRDIGSNLTVTELGLANVYELNLWGYCATWQNNSRICSKPTYDWASSALNVSSGQLFFVTPAAKNVTLPQTASDGIVLFDKLTRYTEIFFVVAAITLAISLFFGLFATCSRIFSFIVWITQGISTVLYLVAAALATATIGGLYAVGDDVLKFYGVTVDLNPTFLGILWAGFVLSIAAGIFWGTTICCCAPWDHHRYGGGRHAVKNYDDGYAYAAPRQAAPVVNIVNSAPARDVGYEPYSHRA